MKKIILIFILFSSILIAQEKESPENTNPEQKPKNTYIDSSKIDKDKFSILIFNFDNNTNDRKNDYLKQILPKSIKIEIDKTSQYNTFTTNVGKNIKGLNSSQYSSYLTELAIISKDNNVQYIVTGSYTIEKKKISITTHVYISRLNKIVKLTAEREVLGVLMNDLIDEIAIKISREFKRYYQLKSDAPLIEPNSGLYPFYVNVKLDTEIRDTELWYTTDGSTPTKSNGKKFEDEEIIIKESATFKVTAFKNGWKPSETITREYKIKHQPDLFLVNLGYSYMYFINDPWKDEINKSNGMMYSLNFFMDLGAIDKIKPKPAIRDFGFVASLEAAHAQTEQQVEPMHFNFWGVHGGLLYKMRLNRLFSIDAAFTGGAMYTVIYFDEEYDGLINSGKLPEIESESTDPYFTSSLNMNGKFGSVVLTIGASFRYIYYKENPAQIFTANAAIGYSFF